MRLLKYSVWAAGADRQQGGLPAPAAGCARWEGNNALGGGLCLPVAYDSLQEHTAVLVVNLFVRSGARRCQELGSTATGADQTGLQAQVKRMLKKDQPETVTHEEAACQVLLAAVAASMKYDTLRSPCRQR